MASNGSAVATTATCVRCGRARSRKFLVEGECPHGSYWQCASVVTCQRVAKVARKVADLRERIRQGEREAYGAAPAVMADQAAALRPLRVELARLEAQL